MPDHTNHWENVYRSQPPNSWSWFELDPATSLALLDHAGLDTQSSVIDVGAGASTLVDELLSRGVQHVTVLDIAAASLELSRARLGDPTALVTWMECDVLTAPLPPATFDIWHDRAVFHFLTAAADRARYVAQLTHSLRAGGQVVLATFAEDGPPRCSGLDVMRFTPEVLARELGPEFDLRETLHVSHLTPRGATQSFLYTRWAREAQ